MKATDLMIGDWVSVDSQIGQVMFYSQINALVQIAENHGIECEAKDIKPIPLTEGILINNGFPRVEDPLYDIPIFETPFSKGGFYFEHWKSGFGLTDHCYIRIQYVHEFQHLLKLCGIDKEIILET